MYEINAQHYANVVKLPAPERYDYFAKRVADWEKVWTLEGERGWFASADDEGVIHLPLWPHPLFAEMGMVGHSSKAKVVALDLDDLLDNVLPQLESTQQRVSVMPFEGGGVSVDPKRLRDDLLAELEKIE